MSDEDANDVTVRLGERPMTWESGKSNGNRAGIPDASDVIYSSCLADSIEWHRSSLNGWHGTVGEPYSWSPQLVPSVVRVPLRSVFGLGFPRFGTNFFSTSARTQPCCKIGALDHDD